MEVIICRGAPNTGKSTFINKNIVGQLAVPGFEDLKDGINGTSVCADTLVIQAPWGLDTIPQKAIDKINEMIENTEMTVQFMMERPKVVPTPKKMYIEIFDNDLGRLSELKKYTVINF